MATATEETKTWDHRRRVGCNSGNDICCGLVSSSNTFSGCMVVLSWPGLVNLAALVHWGVPAQLSVTYDVLHMFSCGNCPKIQPQSFGRFSVGVLNRIVFASVTPTISGWSRSFFFFGYSQLRKSCIVCFTVNCEIRRNTPPLRYAFDIFNYKF